MSRSLTQSQILALHLSAIAAYETLLSVDAGMAAEFADRYGIEPGASPGCYTVARFYPHTYLAALTLPR